jgi:hypothetical protein
MCAADTGAISHGFGAVSRDGAAANNHDTARAADLSSAALKGDAAEENLNPLGRLYYAASARRSAWASARRQARRGYVERSA